MIAKKNAKTEARSANSAAALVDYILDAKGLGAKVLFSWATNCADPSDIALCAQEMTATQALNQRTERSKTYHLIVSLAPGERLDEGQLRQVEEHFCKALGLAEHQRICAVHSDTQNLHMHLAISKVHPVTLNCIEPYRDYRKLQAACRELEAEFGLKPGIHRDGRGDGQDHDPGKGSEVHRHITSFQTWLKQQVREGLLALMASGGGWQVLQDYLGEFDVEIRERGAGFVFAHRHQKLFVKASAVDRSLSRRGIEAAFGVFEPVKSEILAKTSYRSAPLSASKESEALYLVYSAEREAQQAQRAGAWLSIKGTRAEQLAEIRQRYAARRLEVKLDRVIRKGRKHLVYKALAVQMKAEVQACIKVPRRAGAAVPGSALKVSGWRDWLHARAQSGDETALGLLRRRAKVPQEASIGILTGEYKGDSLYSGLARTVSRDGAVEYRTSNGSFIDYGPRIVVKSSDLELVKVALTVAQAKFGASLRCDAGQEVFEAAGLIKAPEKDLAVSIPEKGRSPGPER